MQAVKQNELPLPPDTLRDLTNLRHNSGDKESVRLPSLQTDLSKLMKVYIKHQGVHVPLSRDRQVKACL